MESCRTTRGGASSPAGGFTCSLRPLPGTVLVQRAVDGGTAVLAVGRRVRYLGMDAPEVGDTPEFYGAETADFNKSLVEGHRARLQMDVSDRDRFDRLLRYVYLSGVMVNAELVRESYARAVEFPPDVRYVTCFTALEAEAREAGRGMWAGTASLSS